MHNVCLSMGIAEKQIGTWAHISKTRSMKGKSYWKFQWAMFLPQLSLNVLGMCITKAVHMFFEFNFLSISLLMCTKVTFWKFSMTCWVIGVLISYDLLRGAQVGPPVNKDNTIWGIVYRMHGPTNREAFSILYINFSMTYPWILCSTSDFKWLRWLNGDKNQSS